MAPPSQVQHQIVLHWLGLVGHILLAKDVSIVGRVLFDHVTIYE